MLVLRKKRIALTTFFVFMSVFTFMFTSAKKENTETQETVVLPISRKNHSSRCRTRNPR